MNKPSTRLARLGSNLGRRGDTAPAQQPLPEPLCPICGQPNGCRAVATGSFDEPCWCRDVTFSAEVLARVPEPKRGAACICSTCARSPAGASGSGVTR